MSSFGGMIGGEQKVGEMRVEGGRGGEEEIGRIVGVSRVVVIRLRVEAAVDLEVIRGQHQACDDGRARKEQKTHLEEREQDGGIETDDLQDCQVGGA